MCIRDRVISVERSEEHYVCIFTLVQPSGSYLWRGLKSIMYAFLRRYSPLDNKVNILVSHGPERAELWTIKLIFLFRMGLNARNYGQ